MSQVKRKLLYKDFLICALVCNVLLDAAPGVEKPAAVRFGWSRLAEPNLSSSEGLPVFPFQAGETPARINSQ